MENSNNTDLVFFQMTCEILESLTDATEHIITFL